MTSLRLFPLTSTFDKVNYVSDCVPITNIGSWPTHECLRVQLHLASYLFDKHGSANATLTRHHTSDVGYPNHDQPAEERQQMIMSKKELYVLFVGRLNTKN